MMLKMELQSNERLIEENMLSLAALKAGGRVRHNICEDVTASQEARLIDQIDNLEAANFILRGAHLSRA